MPDFTPSFSSAPPPSRIKILLVDDSAVIRGALSRILEPDPDIEIIGSVSNGEIAIGSAQRHAPDIVILDVEMPVMDGLTALPKILQASPRSKVIMFSTLTEKGAAVTIKALSLGAVECLVKPSAQQSTSDEFRIKLLQLIKGLVPIRRESHPASAPAQGRAASAPMPARQPQPVTLIDDRTAYKGKPALIAIGSSTGGPQALMDVLKHLKGLDMPIVITQHMPATFTKILAQHINQHTGITTFEGEEAMPLKPGCAYVAPGGKHMHLIKREDTSVAIHLDDGPPENFCKPAVDPMFRTAIDIYGKKVLGVILTGMGNDGLGGGRLLVKAGGRLIAQDEATSVVWGMPGAVAKDGICSSVLPLADIGPWIKRAAAGLMG